MTTTTPLRITLALALVTLLAVSSSGCSDDTNSTPADGGGDATRADGTGADGGTPTLPETYTFASRFVSGESSVVHSGQSGRHLLIEEIKRFIGELTDTSYASPKAGDVVADLMFFYDFKNAGGTEGEKIKFAPAGGGSAKQATFGDVGEIVSLHEKMPDIESVVGWTAGTAGWGDGSVKPSDLVKQWFGAVETLVLARINDANIPKDPSGKDIASPYLSADGIDYEELIVKFLLGAVALSQAADKYLDDDKDGQGLLSDNTKAVAGKPYTALEHAWDEGFGYFGAAHDYSAYTDEEIAGAGGRDGYKNGWYDSDADGKVDLGREINWGASVNAGKRDLGAKAKTDFSKQAFEAFVAGRHLIRSIDGAPSSAQLDMLRGYRDAALGAWEKAIAATAVHYINDVLQDMAKFGNTDYSFASHAGHWSELKGFTLSLQFNPRSPLTAAKLGELHQKIGDKPVLPGASNVAEYKTALLAARDILKDAYGFDAQNVGDADGNNGW
ncbi:MAG: DUF4856 domain-containing protein [Myxococcales bacterium]|nr:DUF4856 domain-containing protein [Myxococcales bacterium]